MRSRAGSRSRERGADPGRAGDDGERDRAVVGVLEVVGHLHQRRARGDQRAVLEGVLAEDRRADGEHDVVTGQRLPQPGRGRRAGARRTAGGPAGSRRGRRTTPARPAPPSRSARATSAAQVAGSSASAPTTRAGAREPASRAVSSSSVAASTSVPRRSTAGAAISASSAGAAQSSLGTITSAGPRASFASCQARATAPGTSWARAGWLTHTGYSPGQPGQLPGEERAQGEVAAVLLPDDHHQRDAVDPRRRQRAHRIAQPGGGVQVDQRGTAGDGRVPRRDPDDRALVQGEHEVQVAGQAGEEGDLGRAGVGEDRRHAEPAEDVEGRVPDGAGHGQRRARRSPMWSASSSMTGIGSSGAGSRLTKLIDTAPRAATTAKM